MRSYLSIDLHILYTYANTYANTYTDISSYKYRYVHKLKYFEMVCLTGHTRRIEIPGCVQFDMTTNACRGFCVSYSVPSGIETILLNPKQTTTSVGQCCNIVQSEDVSLHDDLLSYFRWETSSEVEKFWSWNLDTLSWYFTKSPLLFSILLIEWSSLIQLS